ncbi:MAG TPA: type II secretion system protein [Gammaproteobacteria bacterium]|nr:type II secretion system protein [Gammaproteobacteria bacterium]
MLTFQKTKGVTLLEIMLVLAIASSLLVLVLNYTTQKSDELRRDKTVIQMQQILNAGMSFYVTNSFWPLKSAVITDTKCGTSTWTDLSALKPYYLPNAFNNNPYGNSYNINCNNSTNGGGFYVYTTANSPANAAIIAGRLPLAYRTTTPVSSLTPSACTTGNTCTVVVANVNIPGQNLNNARSVNFAGVYYSGSCVPAPNCPPNMKPDIMVMPASVSGIYDPPSCTGSDPSTCTATAYPLSSFTAFARGDSSGNPTSTAAPFDCTYTQTASTEACLLTGSSFIMPTDGTRYWRVCLAVITEKGIAFPSSAAVENQHGKLMGSVVAITRCVPNNGGEVPSGSIDVWQNNTAKQP